MPISENELKEYYNILEELKQKEMIEISGNLPEFTERLLKFKGLIVTKKANKTKIKKCYLTATL